MTDTDLMRGAVLVLISLCVALVAVIVFATGSGGAKISGPGTLAANKAAAKADAEKLLAEVSLPPGAQKLGTEPAGDHEYLKLLTHLSANPGFVDTAWWRVSAATPDQVIAAVKASPPSGVGSTGTMGGGNTKTGTSSTGLNFSLRDVPGVLESRLIEVTATALAGGGTGVMIQSQSEGVIPRPAASLVPRTSKLVSVTEMTGRGQVVRSDTVTATSRVRAAVSYFNALELGQPGTTSCPAEPTTPDVVSVNFLTSKGAAPLATASFSGDLGQRGSGLSTECSEVTLKVSTGPPVGLLGGNYISSLNRLLRTQLP